MIFLEDFEQNPSTSINTYHKEDCLSQNNIYDSSNKNKEDILQYSRTPEDTTNDKSKENDCNSSNVNKNNFKGKNFVPKSILANKMNSTSSNQCITNSNTQYFYKEKPNTVNLIFQYYYSRNNAFYLNSNNINQSSLQHITLNCDVKNYQKDNINNNKSTTVNEHINTQLIQNEKDSIITALNVNQLQKEISKNELSMDFLIKNAYFLCGNQSGCRHLQKQLEQHPETAINFYEQIKDQICELSLNSFGNYFIQKLFIYLPLCYFFSIFKTSFSSNFVSICCDPHGTRVIQTFLEKVSKNQELLNIFNSFFQININNIILNQNATHIIIKYFALIQYPHNEELLTFFKRNILTISTNKHSCCTLQKCIELIKNKQQLYELIETIANVSHLLFNDQYGNYITQYVLEFKIKELNSIIVEKYFSNIDTFAFQKISSNVFEKCLLYSTLPERYKIIRFLCKKDIVHKLLLNTYGNYILQQTMNASAEPERTKFIEYVSDYFNSINSFLLQNIAYSKLIKNFPEILTR